MHRKAMSFALAIAISTPALAKADAPILLAKSAKWEVNYDVDSCHLTGAFGIGDQRVITRFTKFQPGDQFQLVLFGKPVRASDTETEVLLDFGLDQKPQTRTALVGTNGKLPLILFSNLGFRDQSGSDISAEITPEQEATISGLTFKLRGGKAYRLGFTTMRPPMAAMRACLLDLEQHWGYDPTVIEGLSRTPTPSGSPARWLNSDDYPTEALRSGHNGLVHFRLDIDETGRVVKCAIIGKTTPDDFEKATCVGISRRAQFAPALDRGGKPVKSYYISTVRWVIPNYQ
jgi:Gram-negative bacterial TonB protein C-terminal